jgi:DNA-binding LacI/PurR family transcriptional regulator
MIEARQLGLGIPHDISIVGFDDTDMSAHLDPPLTTVRVPSRRMGEDIAQYIIRRLESGAAEVPPALQAELIVRSSTAPPARLGWPGDSDEARQEAIAGVNCR